MLERKDGTRYEYHYYLLRGGRLLLSISNHPDGKERRLVNPKLVYDDRTRRPKKGVIHYDMLDGQTHTVEVEAVGDSGFYLGPALYLGFDGKKHGMWRGKLAVEGERIANTTDDATLRRIHQLRDTIMRAREGEASGFGIFESVATGAWPDLELSAEASFL